MKTTIYSSMLKCTLGVIACLQLAGQVTRADSGFGAPTKLRSAVNHAGQSDSGVSLSSDGLSPYLHSTRARGMSFNANTWVSTSSSTADKQGAVKVDLVAGEWTGNGFRFTVVGHVVFNTTATGEIIANIRADKGFLAPNTTFKARLSAWDSDHVPLGQTTGDLATHNQGQGNTQLRLAVSTNQETLKAKVQIIEPSQPFLFMDTKGFTAIPVK